MPNSLHTQDQELYAQENPQHMETEDLFCQIIRGAPFDWHVPESEEEILHLLRYHGVEPLLHRSLKRSATEDQLPGQLYRVIEERTRNLAIYDALDQKELTETLAALDSADIHPLLMKGTPLAYTHYASPGLRPRVDTDMLVNKGDLNTVKRVLEARGYERPNEVSGDFVSSALSYKRKDRRGVHHALDIHWRINNAHWLARTHSFSELYAESVPVPTLGNNARTLGTIHALLLACIHRLRHTLAPYYTEGRPHYGGNRLIWLYDIHLLGESMDRQAWDRMIQMASEKGLADASLDGLAVTQQKFDSAFPADILATLAANAKAELDPATKVLANNLRFLASDFRALPNWIDRIRLLKEHLLPPPAYLLRKYQTSHRIMLPFLYTDRILKGFWRRLVK